ncbi:MAG TPA: type II toxin-antitoxin system RelE/ParE family toxin [Bryobacteraceae bacterium]|nr:type II toxin-antitoxin system RelE/ParE family toxin [Bryobacteraceae bacterium]
MNLRYAVAPSALADLDEIWLYVAQGANIEVAERVVESITGTFHLLAANPEMGRRRPNLGDGMRSFPVTNYRVYYRQDSRGRIRILHIKHAARDEKRLFE